MVGSSPLLLKFLLASLGILLLGLFFRKFRQPALIGYIAAGVILGPQFLGVITDISLVQALGDIGVVFLLFFLGSEVSISKLVARWKIAIIGTFLQILLSIGFSLLIGSFFDWPFPRSLLLGMVISISSTAVVVKLLEQMKITNSNVGQSVLSILISQDMAIAPMLILISFFGGDKPQASAIALQFLGVGLLILLAYLAISGNLNKFKFLKFFRGDHELEVFGALVICMGLASISAFLGLSAALGAFVAGVIISHLDRSEWVHDTLHSFRVLFVAVFFVSIGIIIDLAFFAENWPAVLGLVISVLITNTFINALVLKSLGLSRSEALYSGALLAQVGEFSFILAAAGLTAGMITGFGYQLTVATIATSLVVSPMWVYIFGKFCGILPTK